MGSASSHAYYEPAWVLKISPIPGIKAEVILNEADIGRFRTWQMKRGHHLDRMGYIFNGFEYAAFIHWRDSVQTIPPRKPKVFWHLPARVCGHILHPANKSGFRCPHCEIDVCLGFIEVLVAAMERSRKEADDAKDLEDMGIANGQIYAARRGWRHARLILAHVVMHHENLAELEEKWLQGDEATAWPRKVLQHHIKISAAAVETAYANTKYQAIVTDAKIGKVLPAFKSPKGKKKKRVTFATDIVEVAEPRLPHKFERTGPHYIPGKHAPTYQTQYIDTSGYRSDMASIQQLKIYVVKFGLNSTTPTTSEEGLVGMHPLWPQIRDFMKAEKDGEMDDETDGLMVYQDHEGEVTGYDFAPVQEDKEKDETLSHWAMGWTSLKQL